MRVLIAGGGIGGLTTALACLRRGLDVAVFEQAQALGDVGAGVQLGPDGTRILIALGLGAEMEALACEAAWKEVRLWNSGRAWKLFDLGADSRERFGAPYWFVHRGDLHRVLREAVERLNPGCVRTGRTCTGYRQSACDVTLLLADGGTETGDVLVAADGVHSCLRRQMVGEPDPHFMGIVAWRGLVPVERLPAELARPVGTNWIGPGGHVITYPVRRGELLNIAAFCERSDWTVESWSVPGTREEFASDFAGWHELIHAIIAGVDTPFKWALAGRDPLRDWVDGRVVLLGDAAHPTLPFLAHGAIMALEDGIVLARCLEAFDAPRDALTAFERMRVDRAAAIVEGSADNAKRFHNPRLADPVEAIAYVEAEWQPDKVRQRYDWLFRYDATTAALE